MYKSKKNVEALSNVQNPFSKISKNERLSWHVHVLSKLHLTFYMKMEFRFGHGPNFYLKATGDWIFFLLKIIVSTYLTVCIRIFDYILAWLKYFWNILIKNQVLFESCKSLLLLCACIFSLECYEYLIFFIWIKIVLILLPWFFSSE